MLRALLATASLVAALAPAPAVAQSPAPSSATPTPAPTVTPVTVNTIMPSPTIPVYQHDKLQFHFFEARRKDWRYGPIVYQVIVDRFAPSADLEAKRELYPAPKVLREWSEVPTAGTFNEQVKVWSHEIDFWGGDLQSLAGKLDYIDEFGADVLYLNPIHLAYTNHKYDAQDYFEVSPEYGTRDDVKALAASVHERDMRLMLDGVFNHMGRTSPKFQAALADPNSPDREWFVFGDQYKAGYRGWYDVENLPEVNLDNPAVRARLWGDPDSVMQGWLKDGVDGWRLDVAFDIGLVYLKEATDASRAAKADSVVIGEVWNYPAEWTKVTGGIMNMFARRLIFETARGQIDGPVAGRIVETMIADAGIDGCLRSWIMLDSHDVPRLRTELPDDAQRRMARILQFTLPGAPLVYYGSELGMEGGGDPAMRAPMRWDLVTDSNEELAFTRQVVAMRRDNPALRYGDFRRLESTKTLAFLRVTDSVKDTTVVIANNNAEAVTEVLPMRDGRFMDGARVRDWFTGEEATTSQGMLTVKVPGNTMRVMRAVVPDGASGYTHFKRVH